MTEQSTDNPNKGAIGEYEDLKRELSKVSRKSTTQEGKLEEGAAAEEEFNLDDFLNGMHSQAVEAGSKPKHLGVTWRNLLVEVNTTFDISSPIGY